MKGNKNQYQLILVLNPKIEDKENILKKIATWLETKKVEFNQVHLGPKELVYEIEKNVEIVLELLSNLNVKATFFVLGTTVRDLPELVKKISNCGYAIEIIIVGLVLKAALLWRHWTFHWAG